MKILFSALVIILSSTCYSQNTWIRQYAPFGTKFNDLKKYGSRLFVCAGELWGNNDYGYFSDDEGRTWTKIPELNGTLSITDMAGTLFAFSHDSLYTSADNGSSWVLKNVPVPVNIELIKEDQGILYAASFYRCYVSADTGSSWQQIFPSFGSGDDFIVGDGQLFVGKTQILHSSDHGQTFDTVGAAPFDFGFESDFQMHDSTLFASSEFGFFRSGDSGASWQKKESGLSGMDTMAGKMRISGSEIYLTTMYGNLFRSDLHTISWSRVPGPDFSYSPLIYNVGPEYFVGSGRGLYRSTDSGLSWEREYKGIEPNSTPYSVTECNGAVWACSYNGIASGDGGNNWGEVVTGGEFMYTTHDTLLTYDHWGFMELSFDNGASWTQHSPLGYGHEVRSALKINNKWLTGLQEGLFQSTDDCLTWSAVNVDTSEIFRSVTSLYKSSSGILFTCSGHYIYRSADKGNTWQRVSSVVGGEQTGFYQQDTNLYFASSAYGVFRSSDNGFTWHSFSNGLSWGAYQLTEYNHSLYVLSGSDYYSSFAADGIYKLSDTTWIPFDTTISRITMLGSALNDLYIGVYHKGLYKLQRTIADVQQSSAFSAFFSVFPDPATGSCTIRLAGNDSEKREVMILSTAGQLVRSSEMSGTELKMELGGLSKGVYYVRLQDKKGLHMQKLVIQ